MGLVWKKNVVLAMTWFMLAAKKNNAKAQYKIGLMYLKGLGVEKNEEEAMKWFLLSAEKNIKAKEKINKLLKKNKGRCILF